MFCSNYQIFEKHEIETENKECMIKGKPLHLS